MEALRTLVSGAADVIGGIAVFLLVWYFAYSWPREQGYVDSETLRQQGTFGIVSGLLTGIVAPLYLNAEGWPAILFLVLGGALFFCMGAGAFSSLKWGRDTAYAVAVPGFAAVTHLAYLANRSTFGRPLILKVATLVVLLEGAHFLSLSIASTQPQVRPVSEGDEASKAWQGWSERLSN